MESYNGILASARAAECKKDYPKQGQLIDYIDGRFRRENLVVPLNVARDVPFVRFGQSTNNSCEQFFSSVRGAGYLNLPLPAALGAIISHTTAWRVAQSREADMRAAAAVATPAQVRLHITEAAVNMTESFLHCNKDYEVEYMQLTAMNMVASVTHKGRKTKHSVIINLAAADPLRCCAMATELAQPCKHAVAAIVHVPKQLAGSWSAFDVRLFGSVWHTTTWKAQLSAVPIAVDIANAQLVTDSAIRPWPRPPQV